MKFVVVTKGNGQAFGQGEENWARHDRPSVVNPTSFMQNHIASKAVVVLANVTDDASDADLAKAWEELEDKSDVEGFVADYAEMYAASKAKTKAEAKAEAKAALEAAAEPAAAPAVTSGFTAPAGRKV